MADPLVTIVTPSFNQGRFIRDTIASVLAQDYPHVEYIVMDGGSTDETAAVVAEYGDRLTWISEKDRGQAHAINKGFRMARGEIVAWINSDDVLYPGAVARAVAALAERPAAGAVYGEGCLIDEQGRVKGRFPATEPFNLWRLIHLWDYVLQQSVYFRRDVVAEVGYLDEELNWALDWELLIRIGLRYDLGYIAAEMGALREYDAAKTFSGGHRRFRELVAVLRRHARHRYPPAYFVYGLDTYETMARRSLARWLPAGAALRAQSRLSRVVRERIRVLVRDAGGLYDGGWATDRVEWMLPAIYRRLRLRGVVPQLPELAGQSLRIVADGRSIAERELGPGEFEIEVDVPAGNGRPQPLIVLHAARVVAAEKVGLPAERRPLAYRLTEIVGTRPAQIVEEA